MCSVTGSYPVLIHLSFLLQPVYYNVSILLDIRRWSKMIRSVISRIQLICCVGRYDVEHDETKRDDHKRHNVQAWELWRKNESFKNMSETEESIWPSFLEGKTISLKDLLYKTLVHISKINAATPNVNTPGQLSFCKRTVMTILENVLIFSFVLEFLLIFWKCNLSTHIVVK